MVFQKTFLKSLVAWQHAPSSCLQDGGIFFEEAFSKQSYFHLSLLQVSLQIFFVPPYLHSNIIHIFQNM